MKSFDVEILNGNYEYCIQSVSKSIERRYVEFVTDSNGTKIVRVPSELIITDRSAVDRAKIDHFRYGAFIDSVWSESIKIVSLTILESISWATLHGI